MGTPPGGIEGPGLNEPGLSFAAFVQRSLDSTLYNLRACVPRLAPFADPAAINIQAVRSQDSFSMLAVARDFTPRLSAINLIRHAHFGAGDNPQTVRVRVVGGLRYLGVMQRRFPEVAGFSLPPSGLRPVLLIWGLKHRAFGTPQGTPISLVWCPSRLSL
jgi:hypothetical protein